VSFVIEYANGITLRDKLSRKLRRAIRNETYGSLELVLWFLMLFAVVIAICFGTAGAISGPGSWPYTVAYGAVAVAFSVALVLVWIIWRNKRTEAIRQNILKGVYRENIATTNDYSGGLFLKGDVWERAKDLENNLFIRELLRKPQIIEADQTIRHVENDVQSALWVAEARKLVCDKVEAELKHQLPDLVRDFTGERRFINTDLQNVVDVEQSAIIQARAFLTNTKV
jgi:membrane protein implicated in regulation of membrane protease activity